MSTVDEVTTPSKGAEEWTPVSVDLSHYYTDERRLCLVAARAGRTARVRHLVWRLRRRFALTGALALAVRGGVLHPDEPAGLLRPHDNVRVIPLEKEWFPEHDGAAGDEQAVTPSRPAHQPPPTTHTESEAAQSESETTHIADGSDHRLQVLKRSALALLDSIPLCPGETSLRENGPVHNVDEMEHVDSRPRVCDARETALVHSTNDPACEPPWSLPPPPRRRRLRRRPRPRPAASPAPAPGPRAPRVVRSLSPRTAPPSPT